jgi:hypothetical protein
LGTDTGRCEEEERIELFLPLFNDTTKRLADFQTIDIAKAEFSKLQGNGDAQVDSAAQPEGGNSKSVTGERGQAGQFGQAGQYGAVTGAGFGGGLAKGPDGQAQGQAQGQPGEERKHRGSIYEGMAEDDSKSSPLGLTDMGTKRVYVLPSNSSLICLPSSILLLCVYRI